MVLIGLDSAVPGFVERFVREGRMPATAALMKRGVWGSALPSLPTHTPTNWTTIATGADPMVHGVVEFKYDSRLRKAEAIWKTAERHGRTSILLRYPGTWPRDIERGVVFEHGGNQPSMYRVCIAQSYLAGETVQYVGGWHGTQSSMGVRLMPAGGWKGLTAGGACGSADEILRFAQNDKKGMAGLGRRALQPLEGEISIRTDDDKSELLRLHLLVTAGGPSSASWRIRAGGALRVGSGQAHALQAQGSGGRYRTVSVHLEKDASKSLCVLKEGEWSEFIVHPFRVKGRTVRAAFRFKLMVLAPDGSRMRLHRSEVYPVEGFSYPDGITEELTAACGPYIGTPGRIALAASWMDTYFEEARDQVDWLARAANHLFKTRDWDIYMMEWHVPDFIEHKFFSYVDPESDEYNARTAREGWSAFRNAYHLADRLIGGITRGLTSNDLVVVVSDHGHCLRKKGVLLENALASAGLFDPANPRKSKVARDKVGLRVKASSRGEYEALRDRAIAVLQSLRDEETGVCPVALALKCEEAPLIGLLPEQVGDIVFALRAGYDAEGFRSDVPEGCLFVRPGIGKWGAAGGTHGSHHPASVFSLGDIKAFFLMAGPDVRRGLRLPHPIWLKDIAPTACHVIGLPAPANSNGAVVGDILM